MGNDAVAVVVDWVVSSPFVVVGMVDMFRRKAVAAADDDDDDFEKKKLERANALLRANAAEVVNEWQRRTVAMSSRFRAIQIPVEEKRLYEVACCCCFNSILLDREERALNLAISNTVSEFQA